MSINFMDVLQGGQDLGGINKNILEENGASMGGEAEIVKDMCKHTGGSSGKSPEPWTQARLTMTLSVVPAGKDIRLQAVCL